MTMRNILSGIWGELILCLIIAALGAPATATAAPGDEIAKIVGSGEVVDLTVTISEDYPAHWPYHPPFKRWIMNWFKKQPGPYSSNPRQAVGGPGDTIHEDLVQSVAPYYSQQYVIDDHTGTQIDYPAHFIPPPGSGMPFESEMGWMTGDKYPLENQMGPAVVIDVRSILDKAPNAKSPLITVDMIKADEAKNGEIKRTPASAHATACAKLKSSVILQRMPSRSSCSAARMPSHVLASLIRMRSRFVPPCS